MHRYPAIRLLWCVMGAAIGIVIALSLVGSPALPFLLVSLGGSTVFLFGLTRAPATQPRALFGGPLVVRSSASPATKHGDALWVYALAQVLALSFMLITKTVHPPAGANPILMIYAHAGWSALWHPVFIGVISLAIVAAVWSRLYPGHARYPVSWFERSPPSTFWGGWDD